MAMNFKLKCRIVLKDVDTCVCFKQDGQRFEQPYTVKLNTDTDYQMKFTLRPAIHINKLTIDGDTCKVSQLKSSTDSSDILTYVTDFNTTGYDLSKRRKRKEILIVLELENGIYMKVYLQCKMYKAGETSHAQWGQTLNAIDYDCEIGRGQNFVKILKEKYL